MGQRRTSGPLHLQCPEDLGSQPVLQPHVGHIRSSPAYSSVNGGDILRLASGKQVWGASREAQRLASLLLEGFPPSPVVEEGAWVLPARGPPQSKGSVQVFVGSE